MTMRTVEYIVTCVFWFTVGIGAVFMLDKILEIWR